MRTATEIAVGVLYVVGGVFNIVYTLRHRHEFYGDWADSAWLGPAGSFVRHHVVPRSVVVTVVLIAFQLMIAAAILSRGDVVGPALFLGGAFALVVAVFSSPGGVAANLALAILQFTLAAIR